MARALLIDFEDALYSAASAARRLLNVCVDRNQEQRRRARNF
jgi:hypothetical protein